MIFLSFLSGQLECLTLGLLILKAWSQLGALCPLLTKLSWMSSTVSLTLLTIAARTTLLWWATLLWPKLRKVSSMKSWQPSQPSNNSLPFLPLHFFICGSVLPVLGGVKASMHPHTCMTFLRIIISMACAVYHGLIKKWSALQNNWVCKILHLQILPCLFFNIHMRGLFFVSSWSWDSLIVVCIDSVGSTCGVDSVSVFSS